MGNEAVGSQSEVDLESAAEPAAPSSPPEPDALTRGDPAQLLLAGAAPQVRQGGSAWPLAPRDALLLAWLAIEGPTPRERLALLLWPDSDAAAARNTLRQRLFQLRRQTGLVLVDGSAVLALAGGVLHDLADGDGVLGERDPGASGELAQWLDRQRAQRRQRMRLALDELCSMAERAQDWAGALAHAEELLALEPLSEAAHRRVMRLHYLGGDHAGAMAAFDRCEQALKDELGTRPSAETLQLLATLERAAASAAPPSPEVARLPASVLRPPRLVGRDAAWQSLRQALALRRLPWLVAEAGLGKSRLLQAWVEQAPGWVLVAARPGDAAVPLATLTCVAAAWHQRWPDAAARLSKEELAELTTLLPGLWPEHAAPPRRPAQADDSALVRALAAWWRAAGEGASGLAVDDLQWADEASVELLGDWLAATPADGPGQWLLASRPPAPGGALAALSGRLAADHRLDMITLLPLDEAEVALLLDSLAVPLLAADGGELSATLHRHCGGNPLFVLETIRQAWASGLIGRPASAWVAARPPGVAAVIRERLISLPAGALALARVAALAGPDFDVPLAAAVLGQHALALADDWAALEHAHILRDEGFAHDLVFETVREGVPAPIARHLHGRIAAHLAARVAADAAPPSAARIAARIAEHWQRAGLALQALPWLAQAAEQAWQQGRRREQLAFLSRQADILAAHDRAGEAFDVLEAATRHHLGIDLSVDAGHAWCDRLGALASSDHQHLRVRLLRLHLGAQRGDEPLALLPGAEACVAEAARLGDEALAAEARGELGRVLVMADRAADAVAPLTAAATWAREQSDAVRASEWAGSLAAALDNTARLDEALPWHHAAVAAAQATGDLAQLATLLSNLACHHIDRGELQQAVACLRQALDGVKPIERLSGQIGSTWCLLGGCEVALGHYARGLQSLDEAERVMAGEQPLYLQVIASHRAMAWWQMGQLARARQALALIPAGDGGVLVARVRAALLSARMLQPVEGGQAAARALIDAALAEVGEADRPDLHWLLRIEQARHQPAAQALDALMAARRATHARGLGGAALAALLRSIEFATAMNPMQAAAWAREALSVGERLTPAAVYPAELWLVAAQAFEAAGSHDEARACWADGDAWVQGRARDDVPAAWRATFLDRQAVNVLMRSAAARP